MSKPKYVNETTFADLKCFEVSNETASTIKALRIRGCETFEEAMQGLASEEFCNNFRAHVNLFLTVIDVQELLDQKTTQDVVLENFKFDNARPWIVQVTSTDGNSIIFFKDVEFSFVNIVGKKVQLREQQTGDHPFRELVSHLYDLGHPHSSLLDFNHRLDKNRSLEAKFNHKSDLCRLFLDQIAELLPKTNIDITHEKHQKLIQFLKQINRNTLKVDKLQLKENDRKLLIDLATLKNLFEPSEGHENILFEAIRQQRFDIFAILIEAARNVFSVEEGKAKLMERYEEGRNILGQVAKIKDVKAYEEVFGILETFLTREEIAGMILHSDKDLKNCWHIAVVHNSASSLRSFFEIAKTFLSVEQQRELFMNQGRTNCFFIGSGNEDRGELFSSLIETAKFLFSNVEIKSMLAVKDSEQSNIISTFVVRGSAEALEDNFVILSQFFDAAEIAEMFFSIDQYDNNSLHEVVQIRSAGFLRSFHQIAKTFLSSERLKELFTTTGRFGRNIFLGAFFCDACYDVFLALLEFSKEILTKAEIKLMLKERDKSGSNIMHLHAQYFEEELSTLVDILGDYLELEEISEMVVAKDDDGNNFMQNIVDVSKPSAIPKILEDSKAFLTVEQQREFFTMRDCEGRNVFFQSILEIVRSGPFREQKIFLNLIESAKTVFTHDEIKSILAEKNENGHNLLSDVVLYGYETILKEFLEVFESFMIHEEISKIIFTVNNEGDCAFHVAASKSSTQFLRCFLKWVERFLSLEGQKRIFTLRGQNRRNIFLCATMGRNFSSNLTEFIAFAKKIFSDQEIKSMLTEVLDDGSNIISLTVAHNNDSCLKSTINSLFDILRHVVDAEEIGEMILAFKYSGHYYGLCITAINDFAKRFLSSEKRREIFKMKSSDGNVLVCAIDYFNQTELSNFLKTAKEVLTDKELKLMMTE